MVTSRSFDAKDLSKLLNKHNASVFLRKCKRHIALTPKALVDIKESVLAHLNRLVRKFDPELDAVVLGSRNVSILTNLGTIVDDSPHVHIDVEAEFYLFRPEKGGLLSGVVNKKSRDNIGCLVHGIFNVSIPVEPDDGIDIDSISIGQTLTFCVEVVDFSHTLPYIKGKLIDPGEQSPGKQASGDKKRKRSDQLQPCKKIKSEVDSSFSIENDINSLTPSIKFPTSILKRTSVVGAESSPARRISFYDLPNEPTDETNTAEGKPKKKKKKKESETSVEESPPQQKKRKSANSLGNEPETGVFIQDSMQIDNPSRSKEKVKKKKSEQTKQVSKIADETEQVCNVSQDFKDHSKKKKNKAVIESNSSEWMNTDEKSEEINEQSASPLKDKKKKKKYEDISGEVPGSCNSGSVHEKSQRSMNESETRITREYSQDQEQIKVSTSPKKMKKNKKIVLNEQENTSYTTGDGRHSEEKAEDSPLKRKKTTASDGEGQIKKVGKEGHNVAEIVNKTLEDTKKMKKSQKKGAPELDLKQDVSPKKKQEPNFTNAIESKKEILKKGKQDIFKTQISSLECAPSEKQCPQVNILQAVQLKPVDKKKKSKKIIQEPAVVLDSKVLEYLGKKNKSTAQNSKMKSIANSTIIVNTNSLKENLNSGDNDNSFEFLSPIEKSDDDDNEPLGFITSTQIEGRKTKMIPLTAKNFNINPTEVSEKNSFSDSDSFDVEEFSLGYLPQEESQITKQKKGSEERTTSHINSRERKSQSSSDTTESASAIKTPAITPTELSDTDDSHNSMDVRISSPLPSKQKIRDLKTVLSQSQKCHLKPGGSNSSSSDSEEHSHEQHSNLQKARSKYTEEFSPKSMVSKGVQIDEESDSSTNSRLAEAEDKKVHSGDKQKKFPLTSTKQMCNESRDAESTDTDPPNIMQKAAKLRVDIKNGNLTREPPVSNSNVHKKETKRTKITDREPCSIGEDTHLKPQKQNTKSPVKKKDRPGRYKSPAMTSSNSDLSLTEGDKMTTQKQSHASHKKQESDRSSSDSDLPLSMDLPLSQASKMTTLKPLPALHKKQKSDSSSSDSELPLSKDLSTYKASKMIPQKQIPASHKKQKSDSSDSNSDVPLPKASKTTTKKKIPASHKKHDSASSSPDSTLPPSMDIPFSKAAKMTPRKQSPASHKKQNSDSSDSNSDVPLPKASKTMTKKKIPASHKKHDLASSSPDSNLPPSMDIPLSKAAKTTQWKQSSASHKKQDLDSSSDSDLPLPKAAKMTTIKQIPPSHKKRDSSSSSSDSNLPLSMDLPLSKAVKKTPQKKIPASQEKQDLGSSSDSDLPLPKAAKMTTKKQIPPSHKKRDSSSSSSDSNLPLSMDLPLSKAVKKTRQKKIPASQKKQDLGSSSDSDLPLPKAAQTMTKKEIPPSHKKHDSSSSGSDTDLPLSMDLPFSKRTKMTTQKKFPASPKKHSDIHVSTEATTLTQKQISTSNKKSGLHNRYAVSDCPSHLKTKIPPVKVPLSPHKSSSSESKMSSGREADSKISSPIKKDARVSKRSKQQSEPKGKKLTVSVDDSLVNNLLTKLRTRILDPMENGELPPLKSLRTGKKTNNSKENTVSSKDSNKSDMNSRNEQKLEKKGLKNFSDELLKNL